MDKNKINVKNALKYGDLTTRLSAVLMGLGIITHKQICKEDMK